MSSWILFLHLLRADLLIPVAPSSRRHLHQCRAFVHGGIVDLLSAQRCETILPLPKYRRRVTPEVSAVGQNAPAIRVLLLFPLRVRGAAACDRLDKGVDTQQASPLLQLAAAMLVTLSSTGTVHG
jgi:hypothetical protein